MRALARRGMPVVMACRSAGKAARVREEVLAEVPGARVKAMALDLASFASIRAFVAELERSGLRVGALVNNAGAMCKRFERTDDGLERTLGVNVVGNYLLARLMAPLLAAGATGSGTAGLVAARPAGCGPEEMGREAVPGVAVADRASVPGGMRGPGTDGAGQVRGAVLEAECGGDGAGVPGGEAERGRRGPGLRAGCAATCGRGEVPGMVGEAARPVARARIVNVVSCTARVGRVDIAMLRDDGRHYRRMAAYSRSKRALMILSAELAERLAPAGVSVVAADPGVVDTGMISMQRWYDPLADLLFRPLIKSPARGAEPVVAALLAPEGMTGELFRGRRHAPIGSVYAGDPVREELAAEIERLTGLDA